MADLNFWDGTSWVSLQGPKGDKGDPGKDGSGVTIVGTLTGSGTALPAASAGDMFILGDPVPTAAPASAAGPAQPGDGLVYNGSAWTNVGAIRGPQGPKGDTGAKGDPGQDGATPVEVFKAASAPAPTAGKALSFWIKP